MFCYQANYVDIKTNQYNYNLTKGEAKLPSSLMLGNLFSKNRIMYQIKIKFYKIKYYYLKNLSKVNNDEFS